MNIFNKLTGSAILPQRQTHGSAGYDLFCDHESVTVDRRAGVTLIKTGVSVNIPNGHCGMIYMRSSLALNHGMQVLGGLIDRDYKGEIGVMIVTHGMAHTFKRGDRIAQLVIVPCFMDGMPASERAGGFGSTGV